MERKAPIGASLTVAAPAPLYITVEAKVTLSDGENLATVTDRFKANLDAYWLAASNENSIFEVQTGVAQNWVRYVMVGAVLAKTAGIENYDYTTLRVNGGTADIQIRLGEYPVTQEVNLYE
jgi:hypothetical protein